MHLILHKKMLFHEMRFLHLAKKNIRVYDRSFSCAKYVQRYSKESERKIFTLRLLRHGLGAREMTSLVLAFSIDILLKICVSNANYFSARRKFLIRLLSFIVI